MVLPTGDVKGARRRCGPEWEKGAAFRNDFRSPRGKSSVSPADPRRRSAAATARIGGALLIILILGGVDTC